MYICNVFKCVKCIVCVCRVFTFFNTKFLLNFDNNYEVAAGGIIRSFSFMVLTALGQYCVVEEVRCSFQVLWFSPRNQKKKYELAFQIYGVQSRE